MKFTIKRFRIIQGANTLKAAADLTLREAQTLSDGSITDIKDVATIYGVKLVEGNNGLFLSMPTLKRNDKYYAIATLHSEDILAEVFAEMLRLYEENSGVLMPVPCEE